MHYLCLFGLKLHMLLIIQDISIMFGDLGDIESLSIGHCEGIFKIRFALNIDCC